MHRADRAFSKWIRTRDGRCQADEPHAGNLQAAHLISRSYKAIRTNTKNVTTLCAKHHMYFTHHPLEWENWVEDKWPGRWDELKRLALTYEKVDWKTQAVYWESVISGTV
jgi:HNH endonuclease